MLMLCLQLVVLPPCGKKKLIIMNSALVILPSSKNKFLRHPQPNQVVLCPNLTKPPPFDSNSKVIICQTGNLYFERTNWREHLT